MPYYCTVPRCTSMAGKVKNVSFHQFPRDEELAKLWNKILKRGKPYTKYSKVCSLHFTSDDYTITNAGKYKGQWRTLRKDAIPSRNLPTEAPTPYHRRVFKSWSPSNAVDPRLHQQMAQAIYVQTMLAMQAAGVTDANTTLFNHDQQMPSPSADSSKSPTSNHSDQMSFNFDQIENILHQRNESHVEPSVEDENREIDRQTDVDSKSDFVLENKVTYRCNECSKCFKDPDVFVLHKRIHTKNKSNVEKENLAADNQETLKANPILANLLKSTIPGTRDLDTKAIDNNVNNIESQIMAALAANMENYLRNLSSIMTNNFIDNRIDDNMENQIEQNADDSNVDGPNFDDDDKNDCDKQDFDTHDNLVIDEEREDNL